MRARHSARADRRRAVPRAPRWPCRRSSALRAAAHLCASARHLAAQPDAEVHRDDRSRRRHPQQGQGAHLHEVWPRRQMIPGWRPRANSPRNRPDARSRPVVYRIELLPASPLGFYGVDGQPVTLKMVLLDIVLELCRLFRGDILF